MQFNFSHIECICEFLCSLLLSCAFSLNRLRLPFQCRLTNDWKLMLSAGISLLFIEKLSDSIFDFSTFVFNCCFCSHRSNLNLHYNRVQGTYNYTHKIYGRTSLTCSVDTTSASSFEIRPDLIVNVNFRFCTLFKVF